LNPNRSHSLFPRALGLCDPVMERGIRPHKDFLSFAHCDRRGGIPIQPDLLQ